MFDRPTQKFNALETLDTVRLSADTLTSVVDPLDTVRLDAATLMRAVEVDRRDIDTTTAEARFDADTRQLGFEMPQLDQPPANWSAGDLGHWLTSLRQTLAQFGTHGFDRIDDGSLADLEASCGASSDDYFGEGPRADMMREYLGIHLRDHHGLSVADIAAANASYMGERASEFVKDLALSHWDIFNVEWVDGAEATLRSMRDGRCVVVHRCLDGHTWSTGERVVTRLVGLRDIVVATRICPLDAEVARDLQSELFARFDGRSWRAFMRNEGATLVLALVFDAIPRRTIEPIGHRYGSCGRDMILRLHATFFALLASRHDRATISIDHARVRVTAPRGELTLSVDIGPSTWRFRQIEAQDLHANDIAAMERLGLRPRLHGMVVSDRALTAEVVAVAAEAVELLLR